MVNLFLSFTIAIGGAAGLITLGRAFDFEPYLNKLLPVVPILYAIVYDLLERRKAGKSAPSHVKAAKSSAAATEAGITVGRIALDAAVSLLIRFSLEILLVAIFLRASGQSFHDVYGAFRMETVITFLRGDHPWLGEKEGLTILALTTLATILTTGSWIGYTSRGNAILEGVLTGAVVTLINSLTVTLVLYRSLEEATVRLAGSMGYIIHASFLVVLILQVLLYGVWSGLMQIQKQKRLEKKRKR